MDFIEKLPKSWGKELIRIIVDRLAKYSHFIALAYPISASSLAHNFEEEVYRLHRLPSYIVPDRGTIFTRTFWKELMQKLSIQQQLSTSYHPQTDGQSEKVNQCLVSDVCVGAFQKLGVPGFLLMNGGYHTTIKMSPFEALYGFPPPQLDNGLTLLPRQYDWISGTNSTNERHGSWRGYLLRFRKAWKDKVISTEVRGHSMSGVFFKLKPYKQRSMRKSMVWKLTPK